MRERREERRQAKGDASPLDTPTLRAESAEAAESSRADGGTGTAKGGYRCPGCGSVFEEQAGLRDHFIGGESCMRLARARHLEVAEYDARHCSGCGLLLGSEMFYGGAKGWLCRSCVPKMTKAEAEEECLSDIAAAAIGNAPGDRGGDNVAAGSGRILQPRGVRGDAPPRPSETSGLIRRWAKPALVSLVVHALIVAALVVLAGASESGTVSQGEMVCRTN